MQLCFEHVVMSSVLWCIIVVILHIVAMLANYIRRSIALYRYSQVHGYVTIQGDNSYLWCGEWGSYIAHTLCRCCECEANICFIINDTYIYSSLAHERNRSQKPSKQLIITSNSISRLYIPIHIGSLLTS